MFHWKQYTHHPVLLDSDASENDDTEAPKNEDTHQHKVGMPPLDQMKKMFTSQCPEKEDDIALLQTQEQLDAWIGQNSSCLPSSFGGPMGGMDMDMAGQSATGNFEQFQDQYEDQYEDQFLCTDALKQIWYSSYGCCPSYAAGQSNHAFCNQDFGVQGTQKGTIKASEACKEECKSSGEVTPTGFMGPSGGDYEQMMKNMMQSSEGGVPPFAGPPGGNDQMMKMMQNQIMQSSGGSSAETENEQPGKHDHEDIATTTEGDASESSDVASLENSCAGMTSLSDLENKLFTLEGRECLIYLNASVVGNIE